MKEQENKQTDTKAKELSTQDMAEYVGGFFLMLIILGCSALFIFGLPIGLLEYVIDPSVYSKVVSVAKIVVPIIVVLADLFMLYSDYRDRRSGKKRRRRGGSGSDDYPKAPYPHDGGGGGFGF